MKSGHGQNVREWQKYIYIYHDIARLLVTTTKEQHALHLVAEILQTSQVKRSSWGGFPHEFWKHSIFTSTTNSFLIVTQNPGEVYSENPRKLLGFTLQTARPKLLDCPHVS